MIKEGGVVTFTCCHVLLETKSYLESRHLVDILADIIYLFSLFYLSPIFVAVERNVMLQ